MFTRRKAKSAVALLSATAVIIVNTSTALAASFFYSTAGSPHIAALSRSTPDTSFPAQLTDLPFINEVTALANADVLVAYGEETKTEEIAYSSVERINSALKPGVSRTVREGENGAKEITYRIKYENGVPAEREKISETVTKKPVDKIIEHGNKVPVSKATGSLSDSRVLVCEATAYAMPEDGSIARTATGAVLTKGMIAVDPKVIPLGSKVYIESLDGNWSYGYAVAADTGGAIKGNKVDLCFRTRNECIRFGRRKCRVYVLQ